jgi:gamma-glutamyltranspeptidase/glutathione hydrolase
MDMQTAVSAPRVHHQWQPDVLHIETAPYAISKEAILRLQEFGHEIQQRRPIGVANCIRIDPDSGSIEGGADPRSSTSAASGF